MNLFEIKQPKRRTTLKMDAALALIEQNCSGFLKKNLQKSKYLFRGVPDEAISVGDSNIGERKSANTHNFYTLWFDNNPAWEGFPKRSKSFICTEDEDVANNFGSIHFVLPYDDALVCRVPAEDLWFAFPKLDSLEELMDLTSSAFYDIDLEDPKDYPSLVKALKAASMKKLEPLDSGDGEGPVGLMKKFKVNSMYELFEKMLVPTKKFVRASGADYRVSSDANSEVFIQGKCVFIPFEDDGDNLDALVKLAQRIK